MEWEEAQVEFVKGRECTPGVYPPPWGPMVATQVLTFGLGLWKQRNEALHGVSLAESAAIARSHVTQKVIELYDQNITLHPRFPAVKDIPLEIRLPFTTRILQAWLRQVAQQRAWTQRRREYELRTQRSIQHWFRPLPR